jgi:hypothetical protein
MLTVGKFTIDDEGGLLGPGDYMREQGDAKLGNILAGIDLIFNMTAPYSPDLETAILVALQTDYAGWKGMRQFLS